MDPELIAAIVSSALAIFLKFGNDKYSAQPKILQRGKKKVE